MRPIKRYRHMETIQNEIMKNEKLHDKFEFRDILPEEGEQTAEIE